MDIFEYNHTKKAILLSLSLKAPVYPLPLLPVDSVILMGNFGKTLFPHCNLEKGPILMQ